MRIHNASVTGSLEVSGSFKLPAITQDTGSLDKYLVLNEGTGEIYYTPVGAQGTQGTQGPQGANGYVGADGAQGATGAQGNQGPTGLQGTTGTQGNQGPIGPQGITGQQGNQGPTGLQGTTGAQGNQGPTGLQGTTGAQGNQGPTGPQGVIGNQGNQGPTGLQGTTGAQGNQGPTGPQGNAGPQGTAGSLNAVAKVGDTMTGILTFNIASIGAPNTSDQGARIKLYDNADNTQDYTIGIESQTMWFNTDYNYKWYRRNTQVMNLDQYGTLRTLGYLSTANANTNTVYWAGNSQSADFGNMLGYGTAGRSTMFRGTSSFASVWWGGVDGAGTTIPFAAIDSTPGAFSFWRNSGGTGGGSWTQIMAMDASGLTMNSGNFIGNVTGNVSGTAGSLSNMNISQFTNNSGYLTSLYGWTNTPDSWYGIGQTTSASGATAVGGYYPWVLSYHTGLALSAHSAYGGIRFYNQNYPTGPLASTPVLQIVNSSLQINGTIAMNGNNVSGAGTVTTSNLYPSSYTEFGFSNTNAVQWPVVRFGPADTANGWDEGIIKASTSEGVFGRYGMGIHFNSSRAFGIYSSGWTKIFGFKSDGVTSFVDLTVNNRILLPSLTIGYWDGTYNRIESATRDLFITSYTNTIRFGNSGSTNMTFGSTRNLFINDPESYSGEVRLGAAWSRGGVYASNTLTMSTSSGNINFVSNDMELGGFRYDSANGSRFIVGVGGNVQTPYTLIDANKRPVIYARGSYPVLTLDHTETSNTNHGPTIQFAFNGLDQRQWVIGASGNGSRLDFGMSNTAYSNTNYNPHNGIAGYQGKTVMRMTETGVAIGSLGTYPTIESPAHALDVRGNMRATGIIYANSYLVTPTIYSGGGNISFGNNLANTTIAPTSCSWCEGLNFTMPTTNSWGGLRWRRERGNNDGNWYVGFVGFDSSDDLVFGCNNAGSQIDNVLRLYKSGNTYTQGSFTAGGDVTAYSDIRVKENIVTIDNALEKTLALRGVYYNRTDKEDKSQKIGVIAQEIQQVLPQVVQEQPDEMLSVSYGNIVGVLIEAIKEQQSQIEDLKQQINYLVDNK